MARGRERGDRIRIRRRGARSRSPPPPPPPAPMEVEPPFSQVPHILFQLSTEGTIMARNFRRLHISMFSVINAQSALENKGNAQFLKKFPFQLIEVADDPRFELFMLPKVDIDYNLDHYEFKIPILPKLGFFAILMRAPSSWGLGQFRTDVKLLYRFVDVYLQGFFYGGHLWLFNDVVVSSYLTAEEEKQWVRRLPFGSSYGPGGMEVNFGQLTIGPEAFLDTYSVLSTYEFHTTAEVQAALARMSVSGPEAFRFPIVLSRIEKLCLKWMNEPVNHRGEKHSELFNDWLDDCSTLFCKEQEVTKEDYRRLLRRVAS